MRSLSVALLCLCAGLPGYGQKFSPENLAPDIPTPPSVVERMLEVAHVKASDVVYDLGSGDGRIVIAAAQKFGAKAVGVEMLPDRCRQAQARIHELGLDDRASIVEGNVFHVNFSPATVVTMYFMTDSNERLRPNLEKYLKPGTRVVSNQFPIKGWKPLEVEHVKDGMVYTIYLYEVGKTK
ncbi:MAG TPA: methyltransferase domain-containing protein [Bryobacteraceae bacterium]|jgi:ubiquinone/menaquinone biosynthesis C-methylase UbiE|nr:methyltransferase domain-containing protein [Bryobacteraceae bacterium]